MAVIAPSTTTATRSWLRVAVPAAALLAAAACAAGPSLPRVLTVQPGQRTSVQFVQFDESRVFTLQNASSGSASEVYSDKRGDSMTKVVDDAMLQRLLDIYADQGLFARAERAAPPLARDALIVEQAERRWVFHRGAAAETVRAYFAAKQYFLDTYNRAEAFHSSDAHVRDLEAEDRRVRDSAESARLKLERLGGDRSGGRGQ